VSEDSITATIRIPEELADVIDESIESTNEFSNRPDFVVSAIRYHQQELAGIIEKTWQKVENDEGTKNDLLQYDGIMSAIREDLESDYYEYGGKPIMIVLRIPSGLKKRSLELSSISVKYGNFQRFTRVAIARYYDYLDETWMFNSFIQQRMYEYSIGISNMAHELIKRESASVNNKELSNNNDKDDHVFKTDAE